MCKCLLNLIFKVHTLITKILNREYNYEKA